MSALEKVPQNSSNNVSLKEDQRMKPPEILLSTIDVSDEVEKLELACKLWPFLTMEDMGNCSCVSNSWHIDFSNSEIRRLVLHNNGLRFELRPKFWASSLRVPQVQRKTLLRHECATCSPDQFYLTHLCHDIYIHDETLKENKELDTNCSREDKKDDDEHYNMISVNDNDDKKGRIKNNVKMKKNGKFRLNPEGQEGEILRDVGRTFPGSLLFSEQEEEGSKGQDMLANVLKACLYAVPSVGYCQGMNFVAATLLRTCVEAHEIIKSKNSKQLNNEPTTQEVGKDAQGGEGAEEDAQGEDEKQLMMEETRIEAETFWLMLALMESESGGSKAIDMTAMWSSGVPALRLRCFQFDSLIKINLPKLHSHLNTIGLAVEVLASQWFLTLFAYALPFQSILRCWDDVFMDGWSQILKIAIGHLKQFELLLLPLSLEDTSLFLRRWKFSEDNFMNSLFASKNIVVTPSLVEKLQVDYGVSQIRRRLAARGPTWLQRYGDPLDEIAISDEHSQLSGHDATAIKDEDKKKNIKDSVLDSLVADLLELEGVGRSDAANLRTRIEVAHAGVGSAKGKLLKAENILVRASNELCAAKQAKIAAARAARETCASIPSLSRATSNPVSLQTTKNGKEDGALATSPQLLPLRLSRINAGRSVSEPIPEQKPRKELPQRPNRPPPLPPPLPSQKSTSLPPPPSISQNQHSSSISPSSLNAVANNLSGMAVVMEDFLFGKDLDQQRNSSSEVSPTSTSSGGGGGGGTTKKRTDSAELLKFPSLSFHMDVPAPFQSLAFAVVGSSAPPGSEQRLMSDLRAQQKAALFAERRMVVARSKYTASMRKFSLAQADVEDAVEFKRRLSQQLLHILTMSEDEQFSKMLSISTLFDSAVDASHEEYRV